MGIFYQRIAKFVLYSGKSKEEAREQAMDERERERYPM